ncbi:cytochrome P450 3A4-like [Oculina patagonica]
METVLTIAAAILLVIFLVVLSLYWYGTCGFAVLKKMNVPGPVPQAFFGNIPELKKYKGIHLMMLDYIRIYGNVFAISLGRKPSIVVADPEVLKQILVKDFSNFRNHHIPGHQPARFRRTIFAARDDYWKKIRNMLTPTFSAGKMKLMVPLIEKSCNVLLDKLEKISNTGQSVDVSNWFSKLTLELILSTAFGVDSNIQTDPNSEILRKTREVFGAPSSLRLLHRLPFGSYLLRFLNHLKGTKGDYFENLAKNIIQTRRREEGANERVDLLQLMLTANETADEASKLSDDEIVAQSVFFLLVGYKNTSNTLAFIAFFLATNPHLQEKLRSKIRLARTSDSTSSIYDLAQSVDYLDCVINESLRLCPPIFQMNRSCQEDYDFNGLHIPAGMEVIIPTYAIHRDPDAWPNPEKFDPERFRSGTKDDRDRHSYQFLPFGAGPRNCIAERFALMEIKIALVKILMKYKFIQSPETQVPLALHTGVMLSPRNGVFLRVETA